MQHYDVLIIGGGPAGLSAAIYLGNANKKTAVFEKMTAGGKLAVTPVIENYPGAISTDGFEVAQSMAKQAVASGAVIITEEATEADLSALKIKTDGGEYEADAVIIATGTRSGKLGVAREDELVGSGVSYCAVCDGAFFRGRDVMLVGSGSRSLTDLKYLSGVCRKVFYVTDDALQSPPSNNVCVLKGARVKELVGTPLEAVTFASGGETRRVDVSALFIDTALIPVSALYSGQLTTDANGFIVTDEQMQTSIKGVFAAGDVRSKTLRQVVTAANDGAVAAIGAVKAVAAKRRK